MSANRITFALSLKREQDDINSFNLLRSIHMLKLFKYFVTWQRTSYKFGLNFMKNLVHILPYARIESAFGYCQFIYLQLKLPKRKEVVVKVVKLQINSQRNNELNM